MPSRLTRAALAAGVATVLLLGSGTTLAGWADAQQVEGGVVTAGELTVEPVAASTVVLRAGTIEPLPASTPLIPGDTVLVTSTVSVRAAGEVLAGTLALELADLDGLGTPTATVTTDLPAAAGTDRWTVTPEHDGARATAVVELTVPTTTDGRAPAADRSNWWGQELQHTAIDPGAIRWTLTQEMP